MASIAPSSTRSEAPATASGRRTRLARSTTFKLTVGYLSVFSASALALLTFIYVAAKDFMEEQTIETINAETQGLVEQHVLSGIGAVREIISLRSVYDPDHRGVYLLTSPAGAIAGNLDEWPDVEETKEGIVHFEVSDTRRPKGDKKRIIVARDVDLGFGHRLLVGRDIEERLRMEALFRNAIVMGVGLMAVFGIGGGFVMSRWTIGKLEHVNRTTGAIIAGNMSRRIALDGSGDEFDELAQNLNSMLERIGRLLAGMREVTDNIAHDLRTPLSRMRSRIEIALLQDINTESARELLEATMHDADSLIETFNALLNIARAEAGAERSEWERIDLGEVVQDIAELYEPLAEEKGIVLDRSTTRGVDVVGSRQLLSQAIANLTDNAIKYTQAGGRITLSAGLAPHPMVRCDDNGPGIPAELREKALQRFTRLQPDRSTPGNGLGLSLVNAVVRLHDATLELGDNHPGLSVVVRFRNSSPPGAGASAKPV